MSGRPTPRLHRLPVRTDYILVPAPLDLTLPEMTEKSTLPAIIVTPSSPSSARDFSIAFIQPPPKQSIRERISTMYYYQATSLRLRSIIIVLLLVFVLLCHLLTHQLASAYRPRMDMEEQGVPGQGPVTRFKSVQKSFSWSRIMSGGSPHGVADRHAGGAVSGGPAAVRGGPSAPSDHDQVEKDILGIALDADDGAGRVEAL